MNFSQNLKDFCIEKNINLKQLAELVNIQDSLLYKYDNGKSLPTIKNIVKLANFFDCSVNYFVGLTDKPKNITFCNNYNKTLFYPRYSELLDKNNTTHYLLSKKLKFSMSSLRNWKNGGIPYLDTLCKLAQFFDVSVDYLIGRSNSI